MQHEGTDRVVSTCEGVCSPGTTTAPNQAQYDEHHVARLRLIRALREGAGLSIATLGRVIGAMETHQPRTGLPT
jgi:DNA-binding transcriptional MerR regulator